MEAFDIYRDIAERTDGDIYIGVVGPVRTGKSTFIKRFMDLMVLPRLMDSNEKERVVDELPQSATGKTVMTTQPKFVPTAAVKININDVATMNVRMVDCVGYMVKGALGHMENNMPRMVRTPWYDHDIPFEDAAEIGTRKVIAEHATIGIVMTTDGSITEIPRSSYINAEERVVTELKALKKPFVVILNSANPASDDARRLQTAMQDKYGVSVLLMDIMRLDEEGIKSMLENMLYEFPMREVHIRYPAWAQALDDDHWLIRGMMEDVQRGIGGLSKVKDYRELLDAFENASYVREKKTEDIRLGQGMVNVSLSFDDDLFYRVLGEECGVPIEDDYNLISIMKSLTHAKREYDKLEKAVEAVRETGYGLVPPALDELMLEEPEIIRQGGRFGVRLRASAPSLHLIRVDIQTEVSPIVGTEKQSEDLVKYLMSEFENDPAKIWSTDIFGKSLNDLVKEGLSNKLMHMPEDVRVKMQETLSRIVNEGSGGVICILL